MNKKKVRALCIQSLLTLPMMFIICLQGYNLRAHLQRIMQFSDEMESSSDDDYSVESFDDEGAEAELQRIVGKDQGEGHDRNITPKPTNQTSNALVAVEGEIFSTLFCIHREY